MEDESHTYRDNYAPDGVNTLKYFSEFWQGHVNPNDTTFPTENQLAANQNITSTTPLSIYTVKSGYGNKCKVEIISRTDLLRARGFKTDDSESSGDTLQGESQIVGG